MALVNQDTYDEVVEENIREFEMTKEEAVEEAVKQFQAQASPITGLRPLSPHPSYRRLCSGSRPE